MSSTETIPSSEKYPPPSKATVNGASLYYEVHGAGEPLVLVHGSWDDATTWASVVPGLAESFQVVVYDRRGHSRSAGPDTQGNVDEDGDDLAALLQSLDLAPAHVVTSSFGGNIALRLATRRPDVFASLTCHEPPLLGLLKDDPASQAMTQHVSRNFESVTSKIRDGDHEGAARQFIEEVALGPGAWDKMPREAKTILVRNAPTFLDELDDPTAFTIDTDALTRLQIPVCLTEGSESPPLFSRVTNHLVELIPRVGRATIHGADHEPHATVPERYIELIRRLPGRGRSSRGTAPRTGR